MLGLAEQGILLTRYSSSRPTAVLKIGYSDLSESVGVEYSVSIDAYLSSNTYNQK